MFSAPQRWGTLINIGVATTEDPQLTYGGVGVTSRDPVDDALAEGDSTRREHRQQPRGRAKPRHPTHDKD
jgi:hypothetical protein